VDKKELDYKDVDYIKKFLSDRYMIEARRKSGMCAKCQRSLAKAVKKARHLALLPFSPAQKGALPVHYRPRS
jgi:small subunit ribosomal protein S18